MDQGRRIVHAIRMLIESSSSKEVNRPIDPEGR